MGNNCCASDRKKDKVIAKEKLLIQQIKTKKRLLNVMKNSNIEVKKSVRLNLSSNDSESEQELDGISLDISEISSRQSLVKKYESPAEYLTTDEPTLKQNNN